MIKKIKGFIIIILITLFIVIILKLTSSNKTLLDNSESYFSVKTEKIILNEYQPEFLFYGNIKALRQVDISAKLSGKITKISPKVLTNGYFEKGETIFQLDPFKFNQELIEKRAILEDFINELESMNLIYIEVDQQKELSRKNYERKKELLGDIITKKNLEDAATNLSLNIAKVLDIQSKIKSLQANIDIAKTQVNLAKRNLKDTKYKAPFNGKLSNSLIEVGDELSSGKVLGEFLNTKKLNVEFFVAENAYTQINNILDKEVSVLWKKSSFKNKYFAKIFYIDSAINKDRAGLNMRASLEDISFQDPIRPGVFVEVILKGNVVENSFLIEENFIYENKFILILEGDKAIRKKIDMKGFIDDKVIVVGENLNGKNLILTRINNLSSLQKVISIKKK